MKEKKKDLIRDVTKMMVKLPVEKQIYINGIVQGFLLTCEQVPQQKPSE